MDSTLLSTQGAPAEEDPNSKYQASGWQKAFVLCFLYYGKDFLPIKSRNFTIDELATAASEILKLKDGYEVQTNDIKTYYEKAKENWFAENGQSTWGYYAIAHFMFYQVPKTDEAKADVEIIANCRFPPDFVRHYRFIFRFTSTESSHKVAKLSAATEQALVHVHGLADSKYPENHTNFHWVKFMEEFVEKRELPPREFTDAELPVKALPPRPTEDTPTFQTDLVSQLAMSADRTLGGSSSESPEGSGS